MATINNKSKKTEQFVESALRPKISVVGVGGAGGNAVNNMIRANLEGVDFYVANTDAQAIEGALAPEENRIKLGLHVTQGLGAGSKPEVGRASAEESLEEVIESLQGSNMVFITAGMGGGTGTGAAPVIARASRESGILTVGVVTKPFNFEGIHRQRTADRGIEELQQYVDTLIVIPNQNLFRIANERTTFADAFKMADDVLYAGVRGVTDLMIMPGLINLDFADIRAVMSEMGKAMMGTGEAEGDRRALDAAEAAISNPLLDDVSLKGARGVLVNITGGYDMTLYEVDEAATRIRDDVDPEANIIFGSTFDEKLNGRMRVSVVATGIGALQHIQNSAQEKPVQVQVPISSNQTNSHTNNNFMQNDTAFSSTNGPSFAGFGINAVTPMTQNFSEPVAPQFNPQSQKHEDVIHQISTVEEKIEREEISIQPQPAKETPLILSEIEKDEPKIKKTASLFERFTGAARKLGSTQNVQTESLNPNKKDENDAENKDHDLLDIPAFLRRGHNK